jgi:hypothetical protein
MAKGKQTCKILKEIRRQIAAENDIEFVTSECTYKGDCQGTCPKCEAEVRYLERELEKRQRLGKAAMVAGLSVGLLSTSQVALAQQPEVIDKEKTEDEEVMGLVAHRFPQVCYYADSTRKDLLDLLVSPDMEHLSVVGFTIDVSRFTNMGEADMWKYLKESATQIHGPSFYRNENDLLALIAVEMDESVPQDVEGDVEIAFKVDSKRHVSDVKILKGINKQIDSELVRIFESERMGFSSAVWQLDWKEQLIVSCDCVLTIHFPIDFVVPAPLEGEVMAPFPETEGE